MHRRSDLPLYQSLMTLKHLFDSTNLFDFLDPDSIKLLVEVTYRIGKESLFQFQLHSYFELVQVNIMSHWVRNYLPWPLLYTE